MISGICFSKNRAMQLDLLLQSLENAPYITDFTVLYSATNDEFERGYRYLANIYPNVYFIREVDFCRQIVATIKECCLYFLFCTDDSLFYRHSNLDTSDLVWSFDEQQALAFNLRVGLNIKWQNHWHSQKLPLLEYDAELENRNIIAWDAKKYNKDTDVGRAIQLDASIMNRDFYLDELNQDENWKRNPPRTMDNLANCGHKFSPCRVAAFKESVYLNVPVNLVHPNASGRLYADNWGKYRQYTTDQLNRWWLDGWRIDLDQLDIGEVNCGRKEIEYAFTKK